MPTPIDCHATGGEQNTILPPLVARYAPGALLAGKYRLEALLGEGGMGSVWRACNESLDLTVAIKLIRADLDGGALRARLQLEARAAAKLGHPAIVRVYDVGESELGDPFIVMEHLRGETLGQKLSCGRLPAVRAVQLLLPIIDALAAAHSRGIVHRDLKPDNLMIAQEEQHVCPKILDFGVVKLTDPRDSEHKLTEFGAVVGSPEYMSPEQARGRDDIDARTDIWSICVVLYEAVTGCAPFSATNYNALLRSIVEERPKPLSEFAVGDDDLWQILERGLKKDRAQRYAEIAELGQALAAWLVTHGVTEDACGSTLDSKWLSRGNVLSPSLDREATGEFRIAGPLAGERQQSTPDTGIARGPFSATIRPVASGRTLTLGAAVVGCALLGITLLALGHPPRAAARTVRAPAAMQALPGAGRALAPNPMPALARESPAPAATAKIEEILVRPVSSTTLEAAKRPKATIIARPTTTASSGVRAVALGATPAAASSPPPALAKSARPLDLLAPY